MDQFRECELNTCIKKHNELLPVVAFDGLPPGVDPGYFDKLLKDILVIMCRLQKETLNDQALDKYKYFKCFGLRHWVFCALRDTGKYLKLVYASDINIVRHVKIKSDANPYLAKWNSYFTVRMNMKLPGSTIKCTALASA